MATLTVQVNTGTEASPTWTTINADQASFTKVRGRGSRASFRVPNASVTDRNNLLLNRAVRIKLEEGATTQWFLGILTDPRVISVGSGVFNMECELTEYAERARMLSITTPVEYPKDIATWTTVEFTATQDASVLESAPTTNNGTNSLFTVGNRASPTLQDWAFFQFDLSSLPPSVHIVHASLFLTLQYAEVIGSTTDPVAHSYFFVHNVQASWDEATINWNNKPAVDRAADAFTGVRNNLAERRIGQGQIGKEIQIPGMADYVRDVYNGTITNYGLALVMTDTAPESFWRFRSSEDGTAALRPRLKVRHQSPVTVTDVVEDLFTNYWGLVDITGVQESTEKMKLRRVKVDQFTEREEGLEFDRFDSLYDAMELLTNQVAGWEWWIDTTDGSDIVLYFEEADQGAPAGIGESDILHTFEMEPTNQLIVNHVMLIGPNESDNIFLKPPTGEARDAASQAVFGYRPALFYEPTMASSDMLNERAAAILHEREWEYWTVAVEVSGNKTLLPGRQVTLNLPTYGLDGVSFQQEYLVQETRDAYERGSWTRELVLREYIT